MNDAEHPAVDGGLEARLSAEQRAVLELAEGRHVVRAPPGSGKTELLALRLARALAEGREPGTLACLTFTNRAARNMQERARLLAGTRPAGAFVGNFHALGVRLLREAGILTPQHVVLDEEDQSGFVQEAATAVLGGPDPRTAALLEELLPAWLKAEACREAWCPPAVRTWADDRLRDLLRRKGERLEPALADVAAAYGRLKAEARALDFDDLLLLPLAWLVRTPPAGRRFRPAWAQVDEAQDLNELQWEILARLLGPGAHLCVFTDPRQAIFSFLGADPACLERRTAGFAAHDLSLNFRSPASLLAFYGDYARQALARDIPWRSMAPEEPGASPLVLLEPADQERERAALAGRVVPDLLAGDASVAVLARVNREVQDLSDAFAAQGLRHFRVAAFDLFRLAATKDFMAALEAMARPGSRLPWARLLAMTGATPSISEGRRAMAAAHAALVRPLDWLRRPGCFAWGPGEMAAVLRAPRAVVIDTETTGLDPAVDEVVQFAGVELLDGRPGREFSVLLRTDRPLAESAAVHGITPERLAREGLARSEGLTHVRDFLGDAPLLAFNLPFDLGMLEADFRRGLGAPGLAGRLGGACVLEAARALLPAEPSYRLERLIARLGVAGVNSHDALDDARACAALAGRLALMADEGAERARTFAAGRTGEAFGRLARALAPFHEMVAAAPHGGEAGFDDLFRAFLDLPRRHPYQERHLEEVRGKLIGHMRAACGRQPVRQLLQRELPRYRLYRESDLVTAGDRLVVSTVHRAKGLEFDAVVVAGAHDGNYPFFYATTPEEIREEARVLFVAMTRARRRLVVSAPRSVRTPRGGKPAALTRFLAGCAGHFARRDS